MINIKHFSVINANSEYVTFVRVKFTANTQEIQGHVLQQGETLIDAIPPNIKLYANKPGFVRPRWDGTEWAEGATPEEIAAWELEHPAPTPMPPTPMELLQEENRLLRAQITAESDRSDFIEDCIAEMAAQVYV